MHWPGREARVSQGQQVWHDGQPLLLRDVHLSETIFFCRKLLKLEEYNSCISKERMNSVESVPTLLQAPTMHGMTVRVQGRGNKKTVVLTEGKTQSLLVCRIQADMFHSKT